MIDSDALDVVFEYSRPMNSTDIINDLNTLRDMGAISLQSTLEQCPMIYDVGTELDRIKAEGGNNGVDDNDNDDKNE